MKFFQTKTNVPKTANAAPYRIMGQGLPWNLIKASVVVGILICPQKSVAQTNETSYLYNLNDLKNYTTLPDPGLDQYVMAGTIFDNSGSGAMNQKIHYLRVDGAGNVIYSNAYDDPGQFFDERVISVDRIDSKMNIVTALRNNYLSGDASVELLKIDQNGTFNAGYTIDGSSSLGGYTSIVPMGTLVIKNMLYICGYVAQPGVYNSFTSDRMVFVLKFDLSTNTVVSTRTWNYSFSPAPPPTYVNDYDMAMRMKLTSTGLIYVTGGCNVVHPKPGVGGSDDFAGGVLSMLIDPVSLGDIYNVPFCTKNVGGGSADAECGFDLYEFGSNFFIFNNHYETVDSFSSGINYGYNPIGKQWGVTRVDPTLTLTSGKPHFENSNVDYSWGINLIQSKMDKDVILSGYQNNRNDNSLFPTTKDNINPFLTELEPIYDPATDVLTLNYNYWSTLLSRVGTGPYGTFHDYSYRGFSLSNTLWGPRTTNRDFLVTSDIVMASPVWYPAAGMLGLKFIRTNEFGELDACPYFNHDLTSGVSEGVDKSGVGTSHIASISSAPYFAKEHVALFVTNGFYPDDTEECNGAFFFRDNKFINQSLAVTIYPNPAKDYIQIAFKGSISNNAILQVQLADVTGRKVADLYHGNAGNIGTKIALPTVVSGIYTVTVYNGKTLIKTQPLTIN